MVRRVCYASDESSMLHGHSIEHATACRLLRTDKEGSFANRTASFCPRAYMRTARRPCPVVQYTRWEDRRTPASAPRLPTSALLPWQTVWLGRKHKVGREVAFLLTCPSTLLHRVLMFTTH